MRPTRVCACGSPFSAAFTAELERGEVFALVEGLVGRIVRRRASWPRWWILPAETSGRRRVAGCGTVLMILAARPWRGRLALDRRGRAVDAADPGAGLGGRESADAARSHEREDSQRTGRQSGHAAVPHLAVSGAPMAAAIAATRSRAAAGDWPAGSAPPRNPRRRAESARPPAPSRHRRRRTAPGRSRPTRPTVRRAAHGPFRGPSGARARRRRCSRPRPPPASSHRGGRCRDRHR